VRPQKWKNYGLTKPRAADQLSTGSTQASGNSSEAGKDEPFWDALNKNVKNLHAVISGHGESFDCSGQIQSHQSISILQYLTFYHL